MNKAYDRSMFLTEPCVVGDLKLDSNIWYSPLAGYSNYIFRQVIAEHYRPGMMFTEMVKMDALVRYDNQTMHMLDFSKEMHPVGAQLVGSKREFAADCARILEDLGFDLIDLNCGCPVDKVVKDGSGSGLLKFPHRLADILEQMVNAVSIPVTVKIRAGWNDKHINAPLITQLAESVGAKVISIHGRTREQGYKGHADWSVIKSCMDVAQNIKVFGNGDLFEPLAVEKMFQETHCSGALLSRGTIGAPWVVDHVKTYLKTGQLIESTDEDKILFLRRHYDISTGYHAYAQCLVEVKKLLHWYFKDHPLLTPFRKSLSKASNHQDIRDWFNAISNQLHEFNHPAALRCML
jgi:tRNA-dihydrouridine synthase B